MVRRKARIGTLLNRQYTNLNIRMKKTLIAVFLLLGIMACKPQKRETNSSPFQISQNPEEEGFSTERLARIDSFFTDCIKNGLLPNAVTFIVRHDKIVHYKAFGFKNIERKEICEPNSIFRIASQTKAITSVGLMLLYEKGKFLLDDPISRYIPEFKNPTVLVHINSRDSSFTFRPAKSEITIRQLLNHTSGIPYGNAVFDKAHIPQVNSLQPETIEEVVKKIAKMPLDHDPGEKFTYGFNTDVLGYLIEILSGMPLDKYLQKELFEPLGMKDSYFYLPKARENRLVTLYSKDSLSIPLYPCINSNQTFPVEGAKTYFSGGAGLVGTIDDYARFCTMLLHGGNFMGKQILGRKTIELMTRNQIGDAEVWDYGDKFGLGFQLISLKSLTTLPGSEGAFKWSGMYYTDYLIDPKEDLIMLMYSNVEPFVYPEEIKRKFRILVYQALISERK